MKATLDLGKIWTRTALRVRSRKADFHHAIRVAVACGATFALMRLLAIPGGHWAVFTTVIVIQTSIGGTITNAVERLIGTMVGAAAGAAAIYVEHAVKLDSVLVLTALVAVVAFAAASRPTLRAAPLTAVIMLVAQTPGMEPATAALYRTGEILLGGLVGVAATLLIFPAHAHAAALTRIGLVLTQLQAVLNSHLKHIGTGGADLAATALYDGTRATMAELQSALGQAASESASRLGVSHTSEATPRALWRVRNDAVIIGRTLSEPLAVDGLVAPASAMLQACCDFMAAAKASLSAPAKPNRMAFAEAHQRFQTAVEALRAEGAMRGIPFDDLAQTFGFIFALEGLYTNLGELADRLDEARAED